MSNISLREYVRKIENQIENVQVDQAIDHCKHLLQLFPKHLESYRLLGKAFLEKQRYTDASDIFQRVLSSLPDDFISHIGMSIIREDENNLDAAIWHMERAFEVQPSNKAVQDELRRLYTKRDGAAPPKIRLTRGALVRMYTRGELYNQAIAEISAAVMEDPNRVDLEVILAKIYFILGQKVEATETCSKLISKLPYCFEANKILSEVLVGTSREDDVKIFKQRVVDLDPYYQFIDDNYLSSEDVPESNIMVEYLDWDPTLSQNEQPDWAQSIGFAFDTLEDDKDEISSWLDDSIFRDEESTEVLLDSEKSSDDMEPIFESEDKPVESLNMEDSDLQEATNETPEILDHQEEQEEEEEEEDFSIPDWIKDAGWEQSSSEDQDLEKGFNIPEISSEEKEAVIQPESNEGEEDIEPAEMPSWLKDIAPVDYQADEEEDDEIGLKNLEDLFTEIDAKGDQISQGDDTLQWKNEFSDDGFSSELITPENLTNDNNELVDNEDLVVENESGSEPDQEEDDLDWIKNISFVEENDDGSQESFEEDQELPQESELDEESVVLPISEVEERDSNEDQEIESAEGDAWLSSLVEETEESDAATEVSEEIPDWIKSVAEEDTSDQFEITENNKAMPDWMNISEESLDEKFDDINIIFDETDKEIFAETNKDDSTLEEESLKDFGFEDIPEIQEEKGIAPEQPAEISDDETDEIIGVDDEEEFFANESLKLLEEQAIANELQKEETETESEIVRTEDELDEVEEKVEAEVEPVLSEQENNDLESTLAWIDGLAIKQGAEKETKLESSNEMEDVSSIWTEQDDNSTEDESESTPDWLKELEIETGDETFDKSNQDQVKLEESDLIPFQDFLTEEEGEQDFKESEVEAEEQIIASDLPLEVVDETFLTEEFETEEIRDEVVQKVLEEDTEEEEEEEEEDVVELDEELNVEKENISDTDLETDGQESSELEGVFIEESAMIPDEIEDTQPIRIKPDREINYEKAKTLLFGGNIDESIGIFNQLIQQGEELDEIIINIQNALDNYYPIDINLWQVLGDAFLKNNQLQNALDAYSKAEDLLL